MKIRYLLIIILMLSLPWLFSCKNNQYRINISGISADIHALRLENDLFRPDPAALRDSLQALKNKYGSFLQYFSYVIRAGNVNDSSFIDYLTDFCTNKLNNEVFTAVSGAYPDMASIENDLSLAFRHFRYYFPSEPVPLIYTCITGFNRSIITADSVLGISLDRYLGRDCEYYPQLEIYGYISARMNSWNIVPDCMYAWGARMSPFEDMNYPSDNVLAEMIHEGKLRYFEKCMLPHLNDTVLFGFTGDQMNFCRNNEGRMWTYLIENDLLFSTDKFTIRKLTGESPFTSYFTNESPGRAAVWLGFRIIEKYMSGNRDVSLSEMMKFTDVQTILDKAKYSPQ